MFGNAVVAREPLVDECVVGVQQIDDAAILANDRREQHLGLAAERRPQVVVEIGRRRLHVGQLPQIQPLTGKVGGQGFRPGVGEHPLHLLGEHGLIAQPPLARHIQEFVIRNAAPQEERQAGGQLEIADAIGLAWTDAFGLLFDAVQETGRDQDARDRLLDAGFEVAVAAALLVEPEQRLDFIVQQRAAIRAVGERRDDLPRARSLLIRAGGMTQRGCGDDSGCHPRPSR